MRPIEDVIREAVAQPHWRAEARHHGLPGNTMIVANINDLVGDIVAAVKPYLVELTP